MGDTIAKVKFGGYMKGFKDGIPIGLGYFPMALACGIATSQLGWSFGFVQMLTLLLYSGSGQLAVLNLLKGGETALIMYGVTIFVMNCRYILFSISMAQRFDKSMTWIKRILFGLLNTDEIFVVAMKEKGTLKPGYLFGIATAPYMGWVLGSIVGAAFTDFLPASVRSALGIMIFGMFIAIIVPQAKTSKASLSAVGIAIGLSVILECIPSIDKVLAPGVTIMICAITTALVCAFLFPVKDDEDEEGACE